MTTPSRKNKSEVCKVPRCGLTAYSHYGMDHKSQ